VATEVGLNRQAFDARLDGEQMIGSAPRSRRCAVRAGQHAGEWTPAPELPAFLPPFEFFKRLVERNSPAGLAAADAGQTPR
jgi:hypothetical protein